MDEQTKKLTIEEWRQLGYHYSKDDEQKKWMITGSPFGIKTFCKHLKDYALNPKNISKSEHEHYGPYSYLEIMTWNRPGMDKHSIFGTLEDINGLADLINKQVDDSSINEVIIIKEEFAQDSEYSMEIFIKEYGYDPSTSDIQLWE